MAGTFFDGAEGGKFQLEEYKTKEPGLYELEFGTIRVGKDGKVSYHKKGEEVPPIETSAPGGAADVEEPGEVRENGNGIKQRGMTLGGIKQFNEQYGLNVADASKLFNLTLPIVGASPSKSTVITADDPIAEQAFGKDWVDRHKTKGKSTVIKPSDPIAAQAFGQDWVDTHTQKGVTGQKPENAQDGTSSEPDEADQSRGLSMRSGKRGARQQEFASRPGNRAFGGEEPTDGSLVSPMYSDKGRNAYRSGFLDSTAKGPMGVLRDAAANAGMIRTNDGKIALRNGDEYITYTGDKSAREVAFDIGGGQKGFDRHSSDFKSIGVPDQPEVKPDDEQTPATIEPAWKDMTMEQKKSAVTAMAQDFANTFKDRLKDKNK